MNKNKKGFTLVELSIVLVIIGLLIGGILVAQSMIGTAKIQSFVRQIGQFDAAMANFQTKYNGLPGDSVSFSGGDGNGLIEDDGGTGATSAGEIPDSWQDLSATGLKSETGTGYSGTDDSFAYSGSTPALPKAVIGETIAVALAGDDSATAADSGNFYYVADPSGSDATNAAMTLSFTGNDALAIDAKMDDGDSNAGYVYADDATLDAAGGYSAFTAAGCPNAYTTGTTAAYVLRIRAGSVIGTPF